MSGPLRFKFHISSPGDESAGFLPFTEEVTILIGSGEMDEPHEFTDHMKSALSEYYDVPLHGVLTDDEHAKQAKAEDMEFPWD